MTFRIMTFNIRGAVPHRDGPNAWERRASLTLSLIERTTPDLIGFQELMHRNLKAYQKWLRTYQWVLGPVLATWVIRSKNVSPMALPDS